MKITLPDCLPFPGYLPSWASAMHPDDRTLTVKPNCGYLAERGITRWAGMVKCGASGWQGGKIEITRKGKVVGVVTADGPTY